MPARLTLGDKVRFKPASSLYRRMGARTGTVVSVTETLGSYKVRDAAAAVGSTVEAQQEITNQKLDGIKESIDGKRPAFSL